MTVDDRLSALRDIIQKDVGNRGLARDPADNLITHTTGDFAAACRSIAESPRPSVCVVTGFYIPHGQPPACETDGPLGAIFLARALSLLRIPVLLVADATMGRALEVDLEATHISAESSVSTAYLGAAPHEVERVESIVFTKDDPCTHLIALERVGPSRVNGRCHSMRGRDITDFTAPAHLLFEEAARHTPGVTTIGIGDGGNEIGMGKIPHDTIRRNIPNGALIACRVAADHLIVAGVSNWGAYALAAGVLLLRGQRGAVGLFDPDRERELLRDMVEQGPLVDGVSGKQTPAVDGLTWEQYAAPLSAIGRVLV